MYQFSLILILKSFVDKEVSLMCAKPSIPEIENRPGTLKHMIKQLWQSMILPTCRCFSSKFWRKSLIYSKVNILHSQLYTDQSYNTFHLGQPHFKLKVCLTEQLKLRNFLLFSSSATGHNLHNKIELDRQEKNLLERCNKVCQSSGVRDLVEGRTPRHNDS